MCAAFVMDRKEGMLNRVFAAGVSPGETVLAHIMAQFLVVLVQAGPMLFFELYVFNVRE
jgi:hypothetical protein